MKAIEIERTIPAQTIKEDLKVGQSGYVSASAFDVTPDHKIFFNKGYSLKTETAWNSKEHIRVTLMPDGIMQIDESTRLSSDDWNLLGTEYISPNQFMPAVISMWNGRNFDILDRLPEDVVFHKVFEFKEGETRFILADNLRVDKDGHAYLYYLSSAYPEKHYTCKTKVTMVEGQLIISTNELRGGVIMVDRVRDYAGQVEEGLYRPVKIKVEGFMKKPEIVDRVPSKYLAR